MLTLLVSGCSSQRRNGSTSTGRWHARSSPPSAHIVQKGETLYSIAWKYGLNYRELAKRNGIGPPYTIYKGQRLKITELSNNNKIKKKPLSSSQKRHKNSRYFNTQEKYVKNVEQVTNLNDWLWPTKGRVVRQYSATDPTRKGIDIAGKYRQPIVATASGKVVYSGKGLLDTVIWLLSSTTATT